MRTNLIAVAERLRGAKDLDGFWSEATLALENYGVSNMLYGALASPNEVRNNRLTQSLLLKCNYPDAYFAAYGREKFLDDELSAEHCVDQTSLYCWHDASQIQWDDARKAKIAKARFDTDRDLGFHVGLSIPTTALVEGSHGGFGLSMNHVREKDFDAHWEANSADILAICGMLDAGMRSIHIDQLAGLTHREKECLLWLACGLNSSQIADRLGISESTVSKHFDSARVRLRVKTRSQAVARAVYFKLIDL